MNLERTNTDLINPFVDATVHVLKTMASTNPVHGEPIIKHSTGSFGAVRGLIGMAGNEMTGNLLISFDEKSILAIVSRMLLEEFLTINQDVIDAVGEITNMICGGAKTALADQGLTFDLATPMVMTGNNVVMQQTSRSPVLTIPFSTPEGEFVVETNLKFKNGGNYVCTSHNK